jgi:energy-coupling factor transport system permease protein
MSQQFEFLGSTSLGQYIARDSWIHHRDPRARLLAFVFLLMALTFTPSLVSLSAGFLIILGVYGLSSLSPGGVFKSILRALPFLLLLALLQVFLTPGAGNPQVLFTLWGLTITLRGVLQAAALILRFLALILTLNLMIMAISTAQMTAALFHLLKPFEKIGLPVNDITMVVQITLRFIPLIAQQAEKIAKAQASRGADWEKRGFNPIRQARRVIPLIVPLIVTSLRRAETMAAAMDSRGFSAAQSRSSFYKLQFSGWDWVLTAGAVFTSIGLLLLGFWT